MLPVDPDVDVDVVEDAGHRGRALFERSVRPRWPRLRLNVIGAVFVGGCAGGVVRYGAVTAWPAGSDGYPWSTWAVNVAGAFVLAVVIVIAAEVRPSRYLRPLLGTGFCGALTTFSSVVVAAAQLLGQGRGAVAAYYLVASIVGGLAMAALGLVVGRALAENRRRANGERSR